LIEGANPNATRTNIDNIKKSLNYITPRKMAKTSDDLITENFENI